MPLSLITVNNFSKIDTCKVENLAYTPDEIESIIQDEIANFNDLQDSTMFVLDIQRINPTYDFIKAKNISLMAKSVEVTSNGYSYERIGIGSSFENIIDEIQQGNISISFHEFKQGYVMDFLTKYDGEDIIPKDGTVLLPYDYYFKIKVSVLENINGVRKTRTIVDDFYYLDNAPTLSFERDSESTFQKIQANFMPLKP